MQYDEYGMWSDEGQVVAETGYWGRLRELLEGNHWIKESPASCHDMGRRRNVEAGRPRCLLSQVCVIVQSRDLVKIQTLK